MQAPVVFTSPSRGTGLTPVRTQLTNGAVVTVKQTRKTPAVSMNLAVRVGSADDPAGAAGTAHLLARVIDRGTTRRTADEIAELLENRGSSLSVVVGRHQLSLVCACLSEDFDAVFSLLAEMLIAPALPDSEIATRKGEVVTAIRQEEDHPGVRSVEGLLKLLYGPDHPYGMPPKGTIPAVEGITRSSLAAFRSAHFGPNVLSAVIVGDIDPAHASDIAARRLETWATPAQPSRDVPTPSRATERREVVVPMPAKAQVDIAYGFIAIRRTDPAYYAYWLMNNALGQYALGGRLGSNIRERQGMAYSVGSVLEANVGEGPLMVRAGVAAANVEKAVASIDAELRTLRQDGLSTRELNESRQYLTWSMPRALETNQGIATFLQTTEFYGLGLDYDRRLPDLLNAVTLDDVQAAARTTIDPDRAAVVIAGPYER
ncbi:MAG: M16 family metallopeptidase [Vicinamibacterales bacterium]